MPLRKTATKDPIAVLKQKLNKAINDKNTILPGEFEGEEKPQCYHYRKYKETNTRGQRGYSKVKNLSTKIKKLSNQLQDIQIGRAHV